MEAGLVSPADYDFAHAEARRLLDALERDERPLLQLSVRHLPRHLFALDEAGERDQ